MRHTSIIKAFIIAAVLSVLVVLLSVFTATAAPAAVDFETPNLGTDQRQQIDPYTGGGVTFTAMPAGGFTDQVVGLVKNSATSACVEPSDANQLLGTGRDNPPGGSVGLSNFPIRATFGTPEVGPVTVGARFQAHEGTPLRIRLFDASDTLIGRSARVSYAGLGTCGFGTVDKTSTTVYAHTLGTVAYVVMDVPNSNSVFVIDDFFTEIPTCNGQVATVVGNGLQNEIQGTTGNDVIVGAQGFDIIYAHAGRDLICTDTGSDLVFAGSGNDWVWGEGGHDVMYGGPGRDRLFGGPGRDHMWGGGGDDRLVGGGRADLLAGGPGDDILIGGPGNDLIGGWTGDDAISCGSGLFDEAYGGPGTDTATTDCEFQVGIP